LREDIKREKTYYVQAKMVNGIAIRIEFPEYLGLDYGKDRAWESLFGDTIHPYTALVP